MQFPCLLGPQGVNVTALREIKILRELTGHPNIIGLIDAFPQKKSILLVGAWGRRLPGNTCAKQGHPAAGGWDGGCWSGRFLRPSQTKNPARREPRPQVFEFMASDLEAVIKNTAVVLSPADVKSYMQMILRGLAACHQRWVVHRQVAYWMDGPHSRIRHGNGQVVILRWQATCQHWWCTGMDGAWGAQGLRGGRQECKSARSLLPS